jgi:hypothetical protein
MFLKQAAIANSSIVRSVPVFGKGLMDQELD